MPNPELTYPFTHDLRTPEQIDVYQDMREKARQLAELIEYWSHPSREQSLALTKLEEAVMWANASIARHGLHNPEPTNG